MRLRRRSFLLLTLAFFALQTLCMPAFAAEPAQPEIETYNSAVAQTAAALEKKYNVTITYPIRRSGYAAVGGQTLQTLDSSLMFITPEAVREISAFYQKRSGAPINIAFEYPPPSLSGTTLAAFNAGTAQLRIFVPAGDGVMLISGTNPTAIVHEMGHAFHGMLEGVADAENLRFRWAGYTRPYEYSKYYDRNPAPEVFVSQYASSDYHEDFAEVFSHGFTANRPGLGISERLVDANGARTELGKKFKLMEDLLAAHIADSAQALANFKKVYSTPRQLEYNGLKLSGVTLQYIGFDEPNGVYTAVLNHMGVTAAESKWLREIGGWYIKAVNGEEYYAFPGGVHTKLGSGKIAA